MKATIMKCSEVKEFTFECKKCGHCCCTPGYICLTENDIKSISAYMKLPTEGFIKKYTKKLSEFFTVFQGHSEQPCIFLKKDKCSIYSVRPEQCKTFPFWEKNIADKKTWKQNTKHCKAAAKITSKTKKGKFKLLYIENLPNTVMFK